MIDERDLELIRCSVNYLEHVAQEYELDKPNYAASLRKFKGERIEELESLSSRMIEVLQQLENYTEHIKEVDE